MPSPELEEETTEEQPLLVSEESSRATSASLALERVSFANRVAVRTGLIAALLASLLLSLPMPPLFGFLWMWICLLGAGVLAVYLYRKRTGVRVDIRAGARLGWITGVFCFVIALVTFTITMLMITSRGGLGEFYRRQMTNRGIAESDVEEVLRLLENPWGLAMVVLASLLLLFLIFSVSAGLGGALGARLLGED